MTRGNPMTDRPSTESICAPICVSGVMMRFMGRRRSCSLPSSTDGKDCPAIMPASSAKPKLPIRAICGLTMATYNNASTAAG